MTPLICWSLSLEQPNGRMFSLAPPGRAGRRALGDLGIDASVAVAHGRG